MSFSETLPPAASAGGAGSSTLPTEPPLPAAVPTRAAAVVGLAVLGAVGLLFAGRLRELYALWTTDDNYSLGFLVAPVSAWLAWDTIRRRGLPGADGNLRAGLFWVAVGCVLHLWADVIWWPPADFAALTFVLYGVAVLAGGRRWALGLLFPILFLFFMFPLSPVLLNRAATSLQGLVASTATWLLQAFVPAYQVGNKIVLPGQSLEVGEQCSGLRQIVAMAALTLLVAYMGRQRLACRIGIVLAGLPIAVAANLLRVLLMAFLTMQFGLDAISEEKTLAFGVSYHTAWGLLTFVVALGLLLGVAWWLGRLFPERPPADAGAATGPSTAPPVTVTPGLVRRLGVAAVCLAAAAAMQVPLQAHLTAGQATLATTDFLTKPLHGEGNKGFPVSLGAWSGREATPDPATLPYFTAADDKLNRVYVLAGKDGPDAGVAWQLWMVHFRNGRDREHHPRICYDVAGCTEDRRGLGVVPMEGAGAPAQRFCFTRPDDPGYLSYVYYWHYTFEPDVAGLYWLQRAHAEWAVHPSLTVEVFTTARTPQQLDKAAEFVRLVDQELRAHLPPGARRGNEILPITARR
jgi:exosortase